MRTTAIALATIAAAWLGACEGSEMRRPLNAPHDTIEDADDGDDGDDGDVNDDGDVSPLTPTLELWFLAETGELGRGDESVALTAGDEPATYRDTPGYQIDVAIGTENVPAGTAVRVLVDGVLAGTADVEIDSDTTGLALFFQLELSGDGPFTVRVEADVDDETWASEKEVTLDLGGPCTIDATFDTTDAGCIALDPDAIAPPFEAALVHVTRTAGACDRVGGTAHLGATAVTLAQTAFVEGEATLLVPIDPRNGFAGEVSVDLLARDPDDSARDATLTIAADLDQIAPEPAWDRPREDVTRLTLEDDLDGDADNGIQIDVVATAAEGDAGATAVLTVDGDEAGSVTVGDDGTITFDAVTFDTAGDVVVRLEVTDGCANVGALERTFTVELGPLPPTIAIVTPADRAVLLAAADTDPTTTSIYETSFVVRATDAEGLHIAVLCQPATATDPDAWTTVGEIDAGASANDQYTIGVDADVDVVGQASRCLARVTTPDGDVDSAIVRVTFAIPSPTVVIEAPAADTCITSGTIGLSGSATGLDGRALTLEGEGAGPIVVDRFATVTAGDWSGTYSAAADGAYTFTVAATDAFGNPAESNGVTVFVDRAAPVLALGAPAAVVDPSVTADADPGTAGYQTSVVVTVDEASAAPSVGEVCLVVNGGASACQALAATVTFTGVTLLPGANALTISGRDGCGNIAEPLTAGVVLAQPTSIAIVSPGAGTQLAAGDDDPATPQIYDLDVTVDADGATTGATITLGCRTAGTDAFVTVGSLDVATVAANGVYTVPIAVDTAALGTSVECRAILDEPTAATSAVVAWVLALPQPTLAITSPVADTCVRADFTVSGTATSLEGRTVTARLVETDGDVVASADATADASAWTSTAIALGAAADGNYGVVASASDAFGNPAVSAAVGIVIDRTAPTLALTAPAAEDLTTLDDTQPATPGVQVDVVASYADARAGGQVCFGLGTAAATCQPAAATVTFEDVTLQTGDNLLTLTATDACGNPAVDVVVTRTVQEAAPTVAITTPAADLTTAATTLDVVVTVTDGVGPLTGMTVKLLAGGVDTTLTPTGAADGTYTFTAVPLAAGVATTFTAEASSASSATGVSGPRVVTQKNVQPTIALTAPTQGAVFNRASAACANGQQACDLTATATTTNVEDGSAAKLTVVCGAATTEYNATVTANAVSFANVVLADQSSCTLTPSVTDVATQTATGAVVSVTVDRVAPTVTITQPGTILQAVDDADAGTAGLQHALAATLTGVPAGAIVTATLSWNDGTAHSKEITHTVTSATPDNGSYSATFQEADTPGLVTFPEGVITVTVAVSDTAGNPGSATRTVTVITNTSIRITSPTTIPAATCGGGCAAGTVCDSGACWIAWNNTASRQLVTFVSGIATTTNNVRVCSDSASVGGGAATCNSGNGPSGQPYRVVMTGSTAGDITVLSLSSGLPSGTQSLVAEVLPVTGGTWVSSLAATSANERERRVLVDLSTPSVTSITSPSDTDAPTGTLNADEQEAVPRAYDVTFTVSEAATAEVYVNGVIVSTQSVAAGPTTVRVTLPEGTPEVWVVLTDAAGNKSPATPGLGALKYQPTVDVTAPTLAFTRPTKSPLKATDNLDVALGTSAENGRTVTLSDGGVPKETAPVSAGVASFPHATFGVLTDGTHTLTASVTDTAGNRATAATVPATIVVDTVAPIGTILDPDAVTVLQQSDDADPVAPGFQIEVTFSTASGATSWSLSSANNCNVAFDTCDAPVVEASGAVTAPGNPEPPVMVTLDLAASPSRQKILLTTFDAVQNTHTAEVQLTVTVDCAVSFTNLPANGFFNASHCASGASCASASVSVSVSLVGSCSGIDTLTLYDGATELGSKVAPSALESFTFTATHGDTLDLEAKGFTGGVEASSSGAHPVEADFQPPSVSWVQADVLGFTTPWAGQTVTWDAADDLDPVAPGMQFHGKVQLYDDNADGGAITRLFSNVDGGVLELSATNVTLPHTVNGANPIEQELLSMTLTDHELHQVVVLATDAAGNQGASDFRAQVDVGPLEVVPVTNVVVGPRRPDVTVSWTAIDLAGATPASYELRYSRTPIDSEAAWTAACDATAVDGSDAMPPPATAGQTMTFMLSGPDSRAYSSACKFDVRFDDGSAASEVALYLAVRAIGTGGELSALTAPAMASVTNGDLANGVAIVRFDNNGGFFGNSTNGPLVTRRGGLVGDLTGDGLPEWVVFSPNTNGFCVMKGSDTLAADTTINNAGGTTQDHVCLIANGASPFFAGASVNQFGHHVIGLGDVNGDGLDDLGVSGRISTGNATTTAGEGFVLVYLGAADALPNLSAPNIKIRGIRIGSGNGPAGAYSFGTEYSGFCGAGDFDGAIGTGGETTHDIAIGETWDSKVHVIPGQTTWTGASNLTYDISVAGVLGGAPSNTALGAWTVSAANGGTPGTWGPNANQPAILGFRCMSAGDILSTPAGGGDGPNDDLIVLQNSSNNSRVFLFAGRSFAPGTAVVVHETPDPTISATNEDPRSLRMRQEVAGLGPAGGWGSTLLGGTDLDNDGVPDVLIGNVSRRDTDGMDLHVFSGAALEGFLGGDVDVDIDPDDAGQQLPQKVGDTWLGTNGYVQFVNINTAVPFALRPVGNFDGLLDGSPPGETIDLAFGDKEGDQAFLKLNQYLPDASIELGVYPVLDGEMVNRYAVPLGSVGSIGTWVDGGADFDGDGLPDLITGSNLGQVLIFY